MKLSTMREINPKETTRAYAFELWMKAPMPMVTFFKGKFSIEVQKFEGFQAL